MRRSIAAGLFALLLISSCGGDDGTQVRSRSKVGLLSVQLPPEVLGLKVQQEEIANALDEVRPSYVAEAALYSLRTPDDLLQASLQVSRFKDEKRYQTSEFRRTIITQLGASPPRATRMGDRVVWRTSGSNLALAVWFEGKFMYLLSIRDDFDRPRSLIRTLLEQKVGAEQS
jgi:hypothetical protein